MHHQSSPRLHRFGHRRDYTLIPAPLDLNLPFKGEKDALPAIIVTPSSPSSARDFSIAFWAPPPKASLRERLVSYALSPLQYKARTLIVFTLILFILICHVVTHRLALRRPHLEFSQAGQAHVAQSPLTSVFGFIRSIWGGDALRDAKPAFVVSDSGSPA